MFEYVDVDGLSADQALDVVVSAERDRRLAEVQQGLAIARVVKTYRRAVLSGKKQLGSDGTPLVDEFACLEIAAALRRDPAAVAELAADLLDLEVRFPRVWEQVVAGGVPVWVARKIARACSRLTLARALWVDATVAPFTTRLGVARLLRWVDALVIEADPDTAEERAEDARAHRSVWVGAAHDGVKDIYGCLNAADGVFLDGMLARLSDILAAEGSTETIDQRRATALGLLATPARALALLQTATQPTLEPDNEPTSPDEVETGGAGRGPAACAGHVCGTITVPPDKLLPASTILVHVSDRTIIDGHGLCRVDGIGPVPLTQLHHLLGNTRITIRPVLDTDGIAPVDCYDIPATIRRAVLLRQPFDIWPYGTRPSTRLDLDHTEPYRHDGTPGQTRVDNLSPLTRKAHRAKPTPAGPSPNPTPATTTGAHPSAATTPSPPPASPSPPPPTATLGTTPSEAPSSPPPHHHEPEPLDAAPDAPPSANGLHRRHPHASRSDADPVRRATSILSRNTSSAVPGGHQPAMRRHFPMSPPPCRGRCGVSRCQTPIDRVVASSVGAWSSGRRVSVHPTPGVQRLHSPQSQPGRPCPSSTRSGPRASGVVARRRAPLGGGDGSAAPPPPDLR